MDKLWAGFTIIVLLEIEDTYFFAGLLQALRPARQQTPTNSFSRNLKYNRIRGKDEPFQLEQQQLDMPFLGILRLVWFCAQFSKFLLPKDLCFKPLDTVLTL
jgi:hypothetical protein